MDVYDRLSKLDPTGKKEVKIRVADVVRLINTATLPSGLKEAIIQNIEYQLKLNQKKEER